MAGHDVLGKGNWDKQADMFGGALHCLPLDGSRVRTKAVKGLLSVLNGEWTI